MVVSTLSSTGNALLFSSYFGGTDNETAEAVVADSHARIVVAGYTYSTDFPVTAGAYQASNRGYADAVVFRLDQDPARLSFSTLLGGSAGAGGGWGDYAKALAVDALDRPYVAGHTLSTDFPTTPDAAQWSLAGSYDAFLTVLSEDGKQLVYATYLGGTGMDTVADLVVGDDGIAHVTGATTSADYPVTPDACQAGFGGGYDAVLARIDPATPGPEGLRFATCLGAGGSDQARAAVLEEDGTVALTGSTSSPDFPVIGSAFQDTFSGEEDAFVARIDAQGVLTYSSFAGGTGYDSGTAVALDLAGKLMVAGTTQSPDFPAGDTYQAGSAGPANTDVFLLGLGMDAGLPMIERSW